MPNPDAIANGAATEILDRFVPGDLGLTGDRFDDVQQILPDLVVAGTVHRGGLNLKNKPVTSVRDDFYLSWMRFAFGWFVFEIHEDRGDEDEQEDQRHHDVVVKAAARERPPDVSLNGFPETIHGIMIAIEGSNDE